MKETLRDIFKGKVVIVGIGNIIKGDDGFGPCLVERLIGKLRSRCIDAGTTPENYVSVIEKEKPDTVLLVDSAHLDLNPGEWQILKGEDLLKSGFTTHDISAGMFFEYLKSRTNAKIFLLGVQPEDISLGSRMTSRVKKTLDETAKLILEANNA